MHKTELITPPEVELITLDEAKEHLRYRASGKDDEITGMIKAFRQDIEGELHRAFITQEWKVFYDCWENEIRIPFGRLQLRDAVEAVEADPEADPPVEAVEAVEKRPLIKYYDVDGNQQTLDEDTFYWVDNVSDPAKIIRKQSVTYPTLQYGRPNAIEITFTCGYGDAAEDVPGSVVSALKLMLTDYFEFPGSIVVGKDGATKIPGHISNLIHKLKLYDF